MKYILAGALFLLPFIYSKSILYGTVNGKYFFFSLIVLLVVLWAAYQLFRDKLALTWSKKSWLTGAALAALAVYYLSALLGIFPAGSFWSDILRGTGLFYLSILAAAAILFSQMLRLRDWSVVRRGAIAGGVIFSLFTLIGAEGFNFMPTFLGLPVGQTGFTLGNSTFAGVFLLLTVILTLVELVNAPARSVARKVLYGALFLQIISPILLNFKLWTSAAVASELFSRPAAILGTARASSAALIFLLAYLIGLYLVKNFLFKKRQVVYAYNGLWILALVASLTLLFTPGSFIQEEYIKESTAARIIVWESGWEAFKERPLLGWGPENFRFGFERHADNRLFEEKNFGEIWFDRAHNVMLDTLVTVGGVGALAVIILLLAFASVIIRARQRGLISNNEAAIWLAAIPAHFLQLQTGFDTVATYALLSTILAYGLSLEVELVRQSGEQFKFTAPVRQGAAIVLALLSLAGLFLLGQDYHRQTSLVKIFRSADNAEQLALIDKALASSASWEMLRASSSSMLKGLFAALPQAAPNQQGAMIKTGLTQLEAYKKHYENYLARTPEDYRLRMNYAYLLIVMSTFGADHLPEAKKLVTESYALSPENPITYVMDALVELYSGRVASAQAKVKEGLALNPNARFSQDMVTYINRQAQTFPNLSIIKLGNL